MRTLVIRNFHDLFIHFSHLWPWNGDKVELEGFKKLIRFLGHRTCQMYLLTPGTDLTWCSCQIPRDLGRRTGRKWKSTVDYGRSYASGELHPTPSLLCSPEKESNSNWILTFCQQHRVTPGRPKRVMDQYTFYNYSLM